MLIPRVLGMLALALSIAPFDPVAAQSPWQEPQDASEAINNPDRYAWRLFVALNWPADLKQKSADASKQFGALGPVVWETWRNVRNNAADTAFLEDGSDPGPWLGKETPSEKQIAEMDSVSVQEAIRRERLRRANVPLPAFQDIPGLRTRNETRMNKETYEFVRLNKLYNIDAQLQLFTDGRKTIDLPVRAKEIKAQWREIADTEAEKQRYHWSKGSDGKIYGLTALHIITKDLPNWFWTTFEHIDNKLPETGGGRPGNVGWLLPSRDRVACPQPPHNCDLAPGGFGLQGTKWENYRLRGSQIDFIDSRGNATILANSQPEGPFQLTSSCITCHARATIGAGQRLSVFKCVDQNTRDAVGDVGVPRPEWFENPGGAAKFTQLDFVWAFMRARRADKTGVPPGDEPACN